LVASLVVIAASAFAEEQEDSVAEISLNAALADPAADPEAGRMRRRKGRKNATKKKGKNGRRNNKKKAKKNMKGKGKRNLKGKQQKTKERGCARQKTAQCGVDAVEALKFEGSVVDNFITQKKRALNFKGIVDKKKGKKANFANATDNMLDALGGNSTAPVCSMSALRLSRKSAADATANYDTLKNCTINIESDCGIANGTIDEAGLETCNVTIFAIKTKNAECIAKATADEKCACFAEAAVLVATAKAGDCKKMGVDANKAMKTQKKKCVTAFAVCNKAEAAASGLINVCLGGEDVTAAAATTAAAAAAGTTDAAGSTAAGI